MMRITSSPKTILFMAEVKGMDTFNSTFLSLALSTGWVKLVEGERGRFGSKGFPQRCRLETNVTPVDNVPSWRLSTREPQLGSETSLHTQPSIKLVLKYHISHQLIDFTTLPWGILDVWSHRLDLLPLKKLNHQRQNLYYWDSIISKELSRRTLSVN